MPEILSILDTIMMGATLIPEGVYVIRLASSTFFMNGAKQKLPIKVKVILIAIWIIAVIIKLILYFAYPHAFLLGNQSHPIPCLIMYALA